MRDVRRGVAQFPYIWVGALSDGGQREIVIVLLRRRPVLTAGQKKKKRGWGAAQKDEEQSVKSCLHMNKIEDARQGYPNGDTRWKCVM